MVFFGFSKAITSLHCTCLKVKEKRGKVLPIEPFGDTMRDMGHYEIKRIVKIIRFLTDVYASVCERNETAQMQQYLNELNRIIERLMGVTSKAKSQNQEVRAFGARLLKRARGCKQEIEQKLAVRN